MFVLNLQFRPVAKFKEELSSFLLLKCYLMQHKIHFVKLGSWLV